MYLPHRSSCRFCSSHHVTSTLVLEGEGLHLEGLELDGALVIKAAPGARVSVRGLKVSNEGWVMVPLPEDLSQVVEEDR